MNERIVPVKTWLSTATYRQLSGHAKQRGVDVPELLAQLADASLKPMKQKYTRITAPMITAARQRLASGDTLSEIADDYGCSRLGLRKALTRKASQ